MKKTFYFVYRISRSGPTTRQLVTVRCLMARDSESDESRVVGMGIKEKWGDMQRAAVELRVGGELCIGGGPGPERPEHSSSSWAA